jgi:hypothetical protein
LDVGPCVEAGADPIAFIHEVLIIEQGHSTPDEEFAMAQRGLQNWNRLQTTADRVRPSPRA